MEGALSRNDGLAGTDGTPAGDEAVNDGNTDPLQLGSFVHTGDSHSREEGTSCRRQHTAASFR